MVTNDSFMPPVLPLILATDAAYAPGAAVVLWSARRYLRRNVELDVRVLDGGLAAGDAVAFESALRRAGGAFRLQFQPAPIIDGIQRGRTTSPLYFARIVSARLFPDLERALYLDADTIVRRDVAELLDLGFDGACACAVRDVGVGSLGGPEENLPLTEFGLSPAAPYMNTGVLWANLAAWREERIEERTLKLGRERANQWVFQDQSVLNLVLHGRWRELDASWNRQLWVEEDRWQITPPGKSIVHINSCKPWLFPLDRPVGVVRMFARCLEASGWLEHRAPLPKYRNVFADGPAQRFREIGRWGYEFARDVRRRWRARATARRS